jgi:hypothetical protein
MSDVNKTIPPTVASFFGVNRFFLSGMSIKLNLFSFDTDKSMPQIQIPGYKRTKLF